MEPIYPLQEEHIRKFCGNMVCIVTHEGARHVGVLSSCRGGKVYLNEQTSAGQSQGELTYLQGKTKKKGRKSGKTAAAKAAEQVQTNALTPFGFAPFFPFAEVFAIDLAAIAFLFLLL